LLKKIIYDFVVRAIKNDILNFGESKNEQKTKQMSNIFIEKTPK